MATKEQRELPELIGAFFTSWEAARATEAAMAGVEAPSPHCPFDCAVRFGAVESLGQAVGLDRKLVFSALAVHLEPLPSGHMIFSEIINIAGRPDLRPWVEAGGQAVHAMLTKRKNDVQALFPIAKRIRIEILARRND